MMHLSLVFFALCVLLMCYSSQLHELSESSISSSAGHSHRHHHHRRHHRNIQQQGGGRGASEDAVSTDSLQGVARYQKSGKGDRQSGKEYSQQQMKEAFRAEGGKISSSAVPKTTQSPESLNSLSAKQRSDLQRKGQESHHLQGHVNSSPQPTKPRESEKDRPDEHPHHPDLSKIESTSPKTTPDKDDTKSSNNSDVTGDRILQSARDNQDQQAVTEKNVTAFSDHGQKDHDDDDVNDEITSQNKASLEPAAESSDEKLVNRPRWRYILRHSEEDNHGEDESKFYNKQRVVKDNISAKKSRNGEEMEPGPVSDPRSDPVSDLKGDLNPKRGRSHNRPRWYTSTKAGKGADTSSRKNPMKQKEHANTDIHSKTGLEESGGDVSKQKVIRKQKKKDKDGPAVSKKAVKSKWKSKKKNKGCQGCTEAEAKLAEARELHKQVLKAQLLDKLRLVPTFKKQPWPPKLPEQVFPDRTQQDQAVFEDQYYAKPIHLLLFGRDLGPRHRLKKAGTGSYQFGVTDKVKGNKVQSANLWVYKMRDANDVHGQTLVITELQRSKKRRLRERSLVARLDTQVQEGWISFDVTQLVRRWIHSETPASLQLLAIRCKTCHRTNYRAIFGVKSHFRPVLVIRESRKRHGHRGKRNTCDPTNGCCKFDMTVSFEELGIHEIFRPLTIQADYCFGTCERPDAFHYNHTMIVQHMRFNSHVHNSTLRHRLKPCCVPVVLREATIYHYLNAGLDTQVSLVPNLLVERCGCA